MKIETNVFRASDGVEMATFYFCAASTILFLQQRTDGWYHWRDDIRGVIKLRLPIDATLEEAGRKVVGMLIEHLKVSLQMAESRMGDFPPIIPSK